MEETYLHYNPAWVTGGANGSNSPKDKSLFLKVDRL
jgi:hypothetical protein